MYIVLPPSYNIEFGSLSCLVNPFPSLPFPPFPLDSSLSAPSKRRQPARAFTRSTLLRSLDSSLNVALFNPPALPPRPHTRMGV